MTGDDARIERLLQQEVDGANSAAEAAALARLLADDPRLGEELARLQALARNLESTEPVGPPSPLWPAVQAELAAAPPPRATAGRSTWRRWRLQLAWGFAAGLAAGLAVMVIMTDSLEHPTSLERSVRPYGAMGVDPFAGRELSGSPWCASLEGAELSASATALEDVVAVEVAITTAEPWSLTITALDGQRCRGWTTVEGEIDQTVGEGASWTVASRGPGRLLVWFDAPGKPGRLQIDWWGAQDRVAGGELGTEP
jgi:hypothetical protein